MRPKNILFLTHGLTVGGAETFLVNLVNSLDRDLVAPVVLSLGSANDPLYARLGDHVVRHVRCRRWRFDFSPSVAMRDLILHHRIDTVFSLMIFPFVFLRRALRGIDGNVRVILSLHGTRPRSIKEYLQMWTYARMLSGSEEIVTTCDHQKNYLARLYLIPRTRFSTIYNGVDTRHFSLRPPDFDRSGFRRSLGIPADAVVIVNVAGLRREKRHDIMVEALARMRNNGGLEPYLLFVGADHEGLEAGIRRLAGRLAVSDRVLFAGSRQDVRPYYWISDLFTLASTSETFSLAALEAMSTGLPAVLTDVGGASEMIQPGRNGWLVRAGSADALATGWRSCIRELPRTDSHATRQTVAARFNWIECVQRYQALLVRQEGVGEEKVLHAIEHSA